MSVDGRTRRRSGAAPRPPARRAMDDRIRARRRAVAAASARRRRRVSSSLALTVALVLGAAALATTPLFDVETVEIVGVAGTEADQVRTVAAVIPGQNLLRVDRGAISEAVRALPWVASADVQRVPPATLRITVARREPVAVVRIRDASWLVDAAGFVVSGGEREGLAVIDASESVVPPPGASISDAAIRNALAVRAALPAPLRAAVDRYEATSERSLRLRLVPAGLGAAASAEGSVDVEGDTSQADGAVPEAIWVRFGTADRAGAKARAITLLLEQAHAQALRQGTTDLGIAELDVRAPRNPVLVPTS